MLNGIRFQLLLKHGMALRGCQLFKAHITKYQVRKSVVLNVKRTTLGVVQSAERIPVFPTALGSLQMPNGIQFQTSLKLGTVLLGNLRQPVNTIKLQVQRSADTNVLEVIFGVAVPV